MPLNKDELRVFEKLVDVVKDMSTLLKSLFERIVLLENATEILAQTTIERLEKEMEDKK